MDSLRQQLMKHIRTVNDFPKPGIVFRDVTPLLLNSSAFAATIDSLAERYLGRVDVVAGIESRGFIFAAPLALKLSKGFALIRKPGKLPTETIRVEYEKEYGKDILEMSVDAILPGQRVLVIDDLLATGGTAKAACALIAKVGGEIVECAFVVELSSLAGRAVLNPIPVYSLLTY